MAATRPAPFPLPSSQSLGVDRLLGEGVGEPVGEGEAGQGPGVVLQPGGQGGVQLVEGPRHLVARVVEVEVMRVLLVVVVEMVVMVVVV